MSDIANPTQGMTSVDKVLLELRKINSPVTYKNLVEFVDLSPGVISQALSSSRDIGLTKSAGTRGHYEFTDSGKEYVAYLSYGKNDDAKIVLKQTILKNSKWNEIINFLKRQNGLPFDPYDLILYIEQRLGKKWSNTMRDRMRTAYISILQTADLIDVKEGKIITKLYDVGEKDLKAILTVEDSQKTVKEENYEKLETNDFSFKVKKDITVLDFAKVQFLAWIEYLKNQILKEYN